MNKKVRQLKVKISSLKKLKKDLYLLSFNSAYLAKAACPGNFLHVKVAKAVLRRPFSVHKIKGNSVYILFKVKGQGTKALSEFKPGQSLDIIGPLGEGFKINHTSYSLLVAGGIGVAPLVFLAQKLKKSSGVVLLGAKNKNEIVCEKDFKKLGFKTKVATDDGSRGLKGSVSELLRKVLQSTIHNSPFTIYACGPKEMFPSIAKAIKKYPRVNCQVSFEQFMGCGLGICCACTIKAKKGYKKVCKDGPVFNIKDIF